MEDGEKGIGEMLLFDDDLEDTALLVCCEERPWRHCYTSATVRNSKSVMNGRVVEIMGSTAL